MVIEELEYHFTIKDNSYLCEITTLNEDKLISFKDTILKNNEDSHSYQGQTDLTYFKREIFKGVRSCVDKLFIYNNFDIKFKAKINRPSFLKKVKKVDHISNKLITLDIETKVTNNKMEAICISIYDGKITKSFFIDNFYSSEEMIFQAIQFLNKPKYNGFKVYAHNFAAFDAIFILRRLVKIAKIDVKNKDGVLIEIKCRFSKRVQITFRDSYLLLPSSLDSLGKNFVASEKKLFPYDFVNNTNIDYNGGVPDIKYFNDISEDKYNNYKATFNGKT
jgi:hypothetical protein